VKELDCEKCGEAMPLYPGYLLAEDVRHPSNVYVCGACGELNERQTGKPLGRCSSCRNALSADGPATRGSCACPKCHHRNRYPRPAEGPPKHRLFAIEYYNSARKQVHQGRFFKRPDMKDFERYRLAELRMRALTARFVPDQAIPPGDESNRLHRWGYAFYRDLFNSRQLLGLELSARIIAEVVDERVRHALATNLSDLLRYQNMLCRYDRMALKSLDIFSVHGSDPVRIKSPWHY
jgi:adenine-specific DNA methylase